METVTCRSGGFFFAVGSGEARGVGDAAPYGCIIDGAVGRGFAPPAGDRKGRPYGGLQEVRCREESPSHGFAAPLGKGAKGTGGRMSLLRCPKFLRCLTADAGNFDRGHSLTSLPLPLAALGSLPTTSDTGHWFRNDRLQEVRWSVAHMGATLQGFCRAGPVCPAGRAGKESPSLC